MTMTSSSIFFGVLIFWSILVTSPSFMLLSSLVLELSQHSFVRDWPEIWKKNTPTWVFPNIWKFGQVRGTKFDTNVSNDMLRNTAKCQCYRFYRFWVIKGKPTGWRGKINPLPPTRLGLMAVKTAWRFLEKGSYLATLQIITRFYVSRTEHRKYCFQWVYICT